MAIEFTRWFSINKDGNPARPGFYDVAYASDTAESADTVRYWDGARWCHNDEREWTCFGHGDTRGERWRGLTAPA